MALIIDFIYKFFRFNDNICSLHRKKAGEEGRPFILPSYPAIVSNLNKFTLQ